MSDKWVEVTVESTGLARVKLNRPDVHNAFDDKLIRELTTELKNVDKDDKVRLVLLCAEGKSFSAGADLNWMRKMADYSWDENYQDSLALAGLMQTLASMKKPTVAAVQGAAFGGGVGLVACCDIVLASEKAKFCLSEVKLGLIPAVISPYVIKAIGQREAHRYFITAEVFNAKTAKRIGLAHSVVVADEFDNYVEEFLKNILQNGPHAIQQAKNLIRLVDELNDEEELVRETSQKIADIRASQEGKEGVSAFLEKRQPAWIKSEDN